MTVTGELISRLFSVTLDRNGQAPGIEEAAREGAKAAAPEQQSRAGARESAAAVFRGRRRSSLNPLGKILHPARKRLILGAPHRCTPKDLRKSAR